MTSILQQKLKDLPRSPGVYFHKSKTGEIIYVGKAAILKNRVKQYFQDSRLRDAKTTALVAEIADVSWQVTESEVDALFLESELIKRYKPRYNILLRDDKTQTYVRLNMKDDYPHLSFTRQPQDDGADYFGPYYNGLAVKKALRYLRKSFPYSTHAILPKRVCLQYHIGLCPGVEENKISSLDYKLGLRKLITYLKGGRQQLVKQLNAEMLLASGQQDYEQAAKLRNQVRNLQELQRQILFSDREFLDISKDQALIELTELLNMKNVPRRIEGYDISHMQGTNTVASMVVATNGVADKTEYRKFKMRIPGNDDFAHMNEVIRRRFSGRHKNWAQPDLLLIDGGKGQLAAAIMALKTLGLEIPAIGLAKREEEIVISKNWSKVNKCPDQAIESDDFYLVNLPNESHIIKFLQRIRDESHRFAVSYHTVLKRQGQTASQLEDIPGIGPLTRKKLIRKFGSLRSVGMADFLEVAAIVGLYKANILLQSGLLAKPNNRDKL